MTSPFTVREHGKSVRNSPHDTNTVCHFESIRLRFLARPLKWLPCVRVEGRGRSRRVCFVWALLAASRGFLKARATWRRPNSSLTQKHKDALDEHPAGSARIRSWVSPARKWVTLYSPIHPQTGPSIPSCPRASTPPTLICRLNYLIKDWLNFKGRRHPALQPRALLTRYRWYSQLKSLHKTHLWCHETVMYIPCSWFQWFRQQLWWKWFPFAI